MWSRLCLVHMSMPEVLLSIRQNRHTRCTLVLGGLGGVSPACIGSAGREGGQAERRTPALSVLCCPNSETTPKTLIPSNKFDDGMWIGLGKRRTNSEKDGMNSEKDGIHGTPKTPESLYPCGFAGCPRARARKNKKKLLKNWAGLWATGYRRSIRSPSLRSRDAVALRRACPLHTAPGFASGRKAASPQAARNAMPLPTCPSSGRCPSRACCGAGLPWPAPAATRPPWARP